MKSASVSLSAAAVLTGWSGLTVNEAIRLNQCRKSACGDSKVRHGKKNGKENGLKYIIKKMISLIITLFLISLFTFLAFQVIPGDHALVSLGTEATREQLAALREAYGFSGSIPERYAGWLANALRGDFGVSLTYSMPVKELLGSRFPVTLGLGLFALLLIVSISLPLGILSAKKAGGAWERVIAMTNQIGMAIPPFFLGILITLLFGLGLRWFLPGQYVSLREDFFGCIRYLFFPAAAIAIPKIAMLVKFLRSSILRQLQSDYVRTARGKGSTENRILYRHVLKNALIPVVTLLGMVAAEVLAGSIILEQVFNLPGIGRLLVVAVSNRDYPVVQAIVLYMAVLVIVINFAVDMVYQYLDPRMEREAAAYR